MQRSKGNHIPSCLSAELKTQEFLQDFRSLSQHAQGHRVSLIHFKPRIKRLSEGGVESVQEGPCVRGDAVEGQSASRPVQIHPYSAEWGWGGSYVSGCLFVYGRAFLFRAVQTPGLVVVSKRTGTTPSFPANRFKGHGNAGQLPPFLHAPLCLPVAALRQPLSAQHLLIGVKSLWMIRTWLLIPPYHPPVPL
ncbi:hypothetical protein ANANG_G00028250 [Anguilla anguilla]|uniref:Uncharacterized protein n=1 Tax=Anguilla anguilla TaxID=7936 RepID=A0A9D3MRD2_ANGAN|nr:hypothetical protein ANANG_G00028250 [Anguilla anguilla]